MRATFSSGRPPRPSPPWLQRSSPRRACTRPACRCCRGTPAPSRTWSTSRARRSAPGFRSSSNPLPGAAARACRSCASSRNSRRRSPPQRRLAESAFGDGTLLLERYLPAPPAHRGAGVCRWALHSVHLGERDCSIQRRHQKLIEEAPAPALPEELRARLAHRGAGGGARDRLPERPGRSNSSTTALSSTSWK